MIQRTTTDRVPVTLVKDELSEKAKGAELLPSCFPKSEFNRCRIPGTPQKGTKGKKKKEASEK